MIKGWVVLEDCMIGPPAMWTIQEDGKEVMPEIFETLEAARKEIVNNYIEHLSQFIDDQREWDHLNTSGVDEYPEEIEIDNNEIMRVGSANYPTIKQTLAEWRKSL